MNTTQVAVVDAHLRALVRLLLGRDTLQPSLVFLAGSDLDLAARTAFATGATDTAIDIVYATFLIR